MADDGQKIMLDAHFAAGLASGNEASNSYNGEAPPPPAGSGTVRPGTVDRPYSGPFDAPEPQAHPRVSPEPQAEPEFER